MSDSDAKRERIKAKVEASQARLRRDAAAAEDERRLPNLADAYPPDTYRSLLSEYPVLTVALGLGLGVLAGSVLPKRKNSKVAKRAMALASTAAELALVLREQAREKVAEETALAVDHPLAEDAPVPPRSNALAQFAGSAAHRLVDEWHSLVQRVQTRG